MTVVRVVPNYSFDYARQSPRQTCRWDGIEFRFDGGGECDYAVILNNVTAPTTFVCPPENVWAMMQEPPNEAHFWLQRGPVETSRVYTSNLTLAGPRFVHSHGCLPWHVGRSYDLLVDAPVPEKTGGLSWITSNLRQTRGHRARMSFLSAMEGKLPLELFGRGFRPVADKWDKIAPFRFALAVESYQNAYYWTEKLADCFLAWTMPIYFGATRIEEFFPPSSFVRIDIRRPSEAVERIREAMDGGLWEKNLNAIAEARKRVLNEHQLFPFLAREIGRAQLARSPGSPTRVRVQPTRAPLGMRLRRTIRGLRGSLLHRLRWTRTNRNPRLFGTSGEER